MGDWKDLINVINYLGAKIESSGLSPWIKWPLIALLLFFAGFYVIRIFWQTGRSVDANMAQGENIDNYAETYKTFDEMIKNENDPVKKAVLIEKREKILGKLPTK